MSKYLIKVKNSEYTIPKENFKILARLKMQDRGEFLPIDTDEQGIAYFKSLGMEVSEVLND